MAYGFLAAGLLLLVLGSEAAIRGGVGFARAIGLPPLVIGLVVLSILTCAPELAVSLRAATTGEPAIALGAILGGTLFSLLFILGLGAVIAPLSAPPKVALRDGGATLLGAVAFCLMALHGTVGMRDGLALLVGFALYLTLSFFTDWRRSADHSVALGRALAYATERVPSASSRLLLLIFGVIGLALGADFTVSGSAALGHALGLNESFVGMAIVAAGVSLPKLFATIYATTRGRTVLVVGHLVAAAAFDLLAVLGITVLFVPLGVSGALPAAELYVLPGAALLVLLLLATGWRLTRIKGLLMVAAYLGYVAALLWRLGLVPAAMPHFG